MTKQSPTRKLVIAGMMLALGLILPYATAHGFGVQGNVILPMHIPVLLCGFICGPVCGMTVGFSAPILRSLMLGMPAMFPTAVCMAFELATYGAVAGIMHKILARKKTYIYFSLLTAMVAGRVVWGAAMFICVGISGESFTFAAFVAGAITNAVPGIVVQLVLVPILVILLENINALKKRD